MNAVKQKIAIPSSKGLILSTHEWRVFTNDKITQDAITGYLDERGGREDSACNIFYNGDKIPVFIVDWKIVEFLANNRQSAPYKFTAYHRANDKEAWARWLEGKKSPTEIINRNTREGVLKRSVL